MQNEIPELKPCPFCGGKASFLGMDFEEGDFEKIQCGRCISGRSYASTKASAIEHWNTRAEDSRIAALEAQLATAQAEVQRMRDALEAVQECFGRCGSWPPSITGKIRAALAPIPASAATKEDTSA